MAFEDALREILSHCGALPAESIPFASAWGRVLAEPVAADRDDPPVPKSAMDGFAVRSEHTQPATPERPLDFAFGEVIAAGHLPAAPLQGWTGSMREAPVPRPAARIMTGALLPDGADAVIKQEDTLSGEPGRFKVRNPVHPGENVIPAGARTRRGERLLDAGDVIESQALGILASVGKAHLQVHRRPRVAVLALGDELVDFPEAAEPLPPGRIRVTNLYVLSAAARQMGAEVNVLGIAPDDPERICAILDSCLNPGNPRAAGAPLTLNRGREAYDLLITLGGTHFGDFDPVRRVMERLGAQPRFERVHMTPGGSTVFATLGRTLMFSLPGTPTPSWVAFETLVRPALGRMCGVPRQEQPKLRARLAGRLPRARGRMLFVPCRLEFGEELTAHPIEGRHTHEAPVAPRANGLIAWSGPHPEPEVGAMVTVLWLPV
jgi:molybdopterin molybdotransferase